VSITIETFGSTQLVQDGNLYFLYPNGGTAVQLNYAGSAVVAGQFGQWAPIGAEQTASGYEVAWKVAGTDQYTVWNTDGNGNYLSNALGTVSGTSAALESIETSFQQDLNGDGVIGPAPAPPPVVIESFGSTTLTEVGTSFYLYNSSGVGPSLKYQDADFVAGQFGQWTPIGAEQTASGYEVALKVTGADQYAVWNTDSNGNFVSIALNTVSGASAALDSMEASFQQDLNGDGVIGSPPSATPIVIEAFGSTTLTEIGTHFYLYDSNGVGPSLKYQGVDFAAGQFGQWTPIGAEQTANGYEVALKVTGADQYAVWNTDSNGDFVSVALNTVSGTSAALDSMEASFHQDLNGDGVIGSPASSTPTVIESSGSTSLTEIGTNFYLYNSSGAGPSLKYQGADFTAGQFGQWTPIGAEQTASGYEVALKVTGADQYTVWNTDSNGNYVSNALGAVPGTNNALEQIETSFHQDLNGDGAIGPPAASPPTVIEAFGSTTLTEVGTNFYLYNSSGVGPSLKYQGVDVVAGQFGQWAPIGAEQTASGYEVALKVTGADQYTVWNTDSNGNYVSNAIGTVSGTSAALESIETSFHQDLNGDGMIGTAGTGSSPQFVFEGLDSSGAQLYDVTWDTAGLQPFAVRVLTPDHPTTTLQHSFLYTLPVEGGLAQSTWGSGLDELHKLDVQDQYNATIIEPIFPMDPWYANSDTDATLNYETFMTTFLPAWVDSHFATSGTEDDLLLGFSKSGYGALDLLLKHPSVFDAAAAWDFPADIAFEGNGNYGTEANFENNYQLTGSFIDTWKAPFTTQDRIWISGYSAFQSDVSDFDNLLTSHGVLHTLAPQTFDTHSWSGGWLPDAVAGLYGLVESGFQGGSSPPPSHTVIEAFGSTSLTEVGDNFYLYNGSGVGPSLKYQGANVFAGEFGQWAPIGAEQTTSGYEVALKVAGADQYTVWATDSNGNYTSNIINTVAGTDPTLQSLEPSFHQDLNGDGQIGLVGASPTVLDGHTGGQTLTANGPSTLIGGANDILNGGPGADTFVFLQNFGANTVNNFTPLVDTLEFSKSAFADATTALGHAQQAGTDVVITQDAQDVVTLHNVQLANLHATDFHLV
jgi:Tryptophan-rich Synechocystis species C-terminal domain/Putative esterase